jgi:hypothetical protein
MNEKEAKKERIKKSLKNYSLKFYDTSLSLDGLKRENCLTLIKEICSETSEEIIEYWRNKAKQKDE